VSFFDGGTFFSRPLWKRPNRFFFEASDK
jgi:hypothetical protein